MTEQQNLSGREINAMLASRVEDLVYFVFPNAKRIGSHLCVGSLDGEPGQKLKVTVRGPKAGAWVDYGTSASDPRGTGDLIKLLQLTVAGGDIAAAFREARRFLNLDTMDPRVLARQQAKAKRAAERREAKEADDEERRRRNAENLWKFSDPCTPNSPPIKYLAARGINLASLGRMPGAIRFRAKVKHKEVGKELPAMVTKFSALSGQHAATHITYLHYGRKGWVKHPKLEIDGRLTDVSKKILGPAWAMGAHIPLWKGAGRGKLADVKPGTPVFVSEGIEDGLSYAMADPTARIVAAGTLGLIGQVRLPRQAGDMVCLAQNDTKQRPIEQLEEALRAQQQRARDEGVERAVLLKRPPSHINDWNDWLRAGEGGGA